MLAVEFCEGEGITVPYPACFDDIRSNHGFVDLRGRPDLAAKILEGKQSAALQNLLVDLADEGSPFFSVGCDLGSHEEADNDSGTRHVAGGYIQILDRSYQDRVPNDYLGLAYAIDHELEGHAENSNWIVRFVHTSVMFNLDEFLDITPSLWIWFYACAPSPQVALESREEFLQRLREILGRFKGASNTKS